MFVEKVALSTVVGARANSIFDSESDLVLIGVPPGCLLFSSAVAAATDLCLHLLQIINHTHTHTHTHSHTRLVANVGRASNDCASDRRESQVAAARLID